MSAGEGGRGEADTISTISITRSMAEPLVRGAGSGPYGAGALTGAITLRERSQGGVLDVSAAERGGMRAAGSASARLGPVAVTLSGLREVSDGYVPVRGPAAPLTVCHRRGGRQSCVTR